MTQRAAFRRAAPVVLVSAFVAASLGMAHAQPNASFNMVNQSSTAIEEVYASAAGRTNWGRDRLGGNRIPPGASRAIRLPADGNCLYDLRVVYAGGRAEQRKSVNTCTVDSVAFGTAAAGTTPNPTPSTAQPGTGPAASAETNPSFNLINRGTKPIAGLYAAPADQADWGTNRLSEAGLDAGARVAVRLPQDGTCDYKLRVVFKDGQTLSRRKVNLCQVSDIPVP